VRAFPVIFAESVEATSSFYESLGFERHFQLPPSGEPADVPWGERAAYVTDPDGNPVALAAPPRTS
jgi:hypothetical protein